MILQLINKGYSFSYTSAAIIVALSHPICETNPLFIKSSDYTTTANSNELYEDIFITKASMRASEKSLAEDWDNEDDSHWNRFLID